MPTLGTRVHTVANKTLYKVDYSEWLLPGESLVANLCTVTLDPAFTATVTDIVISVPTINSSCLLEFYLSGGSANEMFTVDVHVQTSMGEVKNDTIGFTVKSPT